MKGILLISILSFLGGCTISARNHHFELHNHGSSKHDDFNNIWCYTATESNAIQVCSGAYWSKSEYIGIVFPIIPQADKKSRLAYDIQRERIVEFKNHSHDGSAILSELNSIQLCEGQHTKDCSTTESILVKPGGSVWLKIPEGSSHIFLVSLDTVQFKAKLKQFSESRWHFVSV